MSHIDNRPLAIMLTALMGAAGRNPTPEEFDRFIRSLLSADWNAPDSLILLRRDLPFKAVAAARFFIQAREFLRVLSEEPAGLTPLGNVNRAGVERCIARMEWVGETARYARDVFKSRQFNEPDLRPLHVIRIVGQCAGLVYSRRKFMRPTREALTLLDDARAGELYRRLFVAFFREFNLGFLYGCVEAPFVQDSISVILWRLMLTANDWIAAAKLPPEVLLPQVSAQITQADHWPDAEAHYLTSQVLKPLGWFGLLECDTAEDEFRVRWEDRKYRKTPLFDRFLSFRPLAGGQKGVM